MPFDVIVVGGGAVGACVARALRGHSVALVAGAKPVSTPKSPDEFDNRIYALSPGSVEFLRSLKAWDRIALDRVTAVYSMQVHGDAPGCVMGLDAYRAGVETLAWIVEDRELQSAIWSTLQTQDRLEIFASSQCAAIETGELAVVRLADGRTLEAGLVVGADGADSVVRIAAGIAVRGELYGQSAVVANFSCEAAHGNIARQWFQGGPVLALLPLPGQRVSMVWSVRDEEASRLTSLGHVDLAREVTAAAFGVLGDLHSISDAKSFPLRRMTATRMVAEKVALAGDAAHVIHPLAGQGLNLGLQDAHTLANIVMNREPVRGPGDRSLLRRYERERSEAILAMRSAVHGLQRLFASSNPAANRLRNFGLNFTDRVPVLKNALLRHALN